MNSSSRLSRALPGTYELVVQTAKRYVRAGRALDLGAGSGALAERLQRAGYSVSASDIANYFELPTTFVPADFNDPLFDRLFQPSFDLITSVEVIEHLENPTAFLRCIRRLLAPHGVAIITTPNVENVAARLKFLATGKVRGMDHNSPEHVTPIYLDLLQRKILPASGLQLVEHFVYPENEFPLTGRRFFLPIFHMLSPFLEGPALTGDSQVIVLRLSTGAVNVSQVPL